MKLFIAIIFGFLIGFTFNLYIPVFAQGVGNPDEPVAFVFYDNEVEGISRVEAIYQNATTTQENASKFIQDEMYQKLEEIHLKVNKIYNKLYP